MKLISLASGEWYSWLWMQLSRGFVYYLPQLQLVTMTAMVSAVFCYPLIVKWTCFRPVFIKSESHTVQQVSHSDKEKRKHSQKKEAKNKANLGCQTNRINKFVLCVKYWNTFFKDWLTRVDCVLGWYFQIKSCSWGHLFHFTIQGSYLYYSDVSRRWSTLYKG